MAVGTIDARGRRADVSWPDYLDWRDQTRAFEQMAAFAGGSLAIGGEGLGAGTRDRHATSRPTRSACWARPRC